MNKISTSFAVLFISVFLFAGCKNLVKKNANLNKIAQQTETYNQPVQPELVNTIIKVSFTTNLEDPRGKSLLLFKELVENQTENRIKIQLLPEGKLDENSPAKSDTELIQSLIQGNLDMTVSSAGNYASFIPQAGLSALPYLFSNFQDAWKYMDSDVITEINNSFQNDNMVVLSQFDNGFRCITTSSAFGPIRKLEDINGLNIRTPQNQIVMETMLALGARPKSSSFTTLKQDIRDGKFEAQENPIPVIYNSKLYEVQKYLAITNHSYDAMPLTIRKDLWDSLQKLDQLILKDAALKAQEYNRTLIKEQTENYINLLKAEGMVITYPDLSIFTKATASVIDVFAPVYGQDLIQKIKSSN